MLLKFVSDRDVPGISRLDLGGECAEKSWAERYAFQLTGRHSQPVICLAAGIRRRRLHGIKPQHLPLLIWPAPLREVARVALEAGEAAAQKIRVEREHH